jgi:hypothetical protein
MAEVLKGNFQTERSVTVDPKAEDDIEERFEREALKRLGGSIVFVAKKKVLWPGENDEA